MGLVLAVGIALLLSLPWLIVDPWPREWSVGIVAGAAQAWDADWPVAFNYGPLGYLMRPIAYDRGLWLQAVIWGTARVGILMATTAAVLTLLRRPWTHVVLALAGVTLVLQALAIFEYALHFALQLLMLAELWRSRYRGAWVMPAIALLSLVAAAEVYAKFSQGIMTVVMVGAFAIWLLWRRRPGWAAVLVLAVGVGLVVPGLLLFDSVASLRDFWRESSWVVAAYSDGMQLVRQHEGWLLIGLMILGALTAALVAWPIRWREWRPAIGLALCLPMLGIAYRHGIIRADGHMSILYATWTIVIGCLLLGRWRQRYRRIAIGGLGSIAILMLVLTMVEVYWEVRQTPADVMHSRYTQLRRTIRALSPDGWAADQERVRASMRDQYVFRYDTLATLRGKRVECLFLEVATISYLDVEWAPRPVFQSYQASNIDLAHLNNIALQAEDRAEYILLELNQVDFRYPFHDEPLLVRTLMTHYEPMWIDGRYVLFQKREPALAVDLSTIATATARLNEPIPLPPHDGRPVFITFDLPYSPLGRLKRATWKAWPTYVLFHTDTGPVGPFRMSSVITPLGLLASHTVLSPEDVLAFYQGRLPADVHAIEFRCDAPGDYVDTFDVQFQQPTLILK